MPASAWIYTTEHTFLSQPFWTWKDYNIKWSQNFHGIHHFLGYKSVTRFLIKMVYNSTVLCISQRASVISIFTTLHVISTNNDWSPVFVPVCLPGTRKCKVKKAVLKYPELKKEDRCMNGLLCKKGCDGDICKIAYEYRWNQVTFPRS